MNILVLSMIYLFIMVCVIWMYKKVVILKMELLKTSGTSTMDQYQKHVNNNT